MLKAPTVLNESGWTVCFAYAKCRFSFNVAHMLCDTTQMGWVVRGPNEHVLYSSESIKAPLKDV